MKLESKLGLTTGAVILAMLLSAFTATMRIQEANRLAASATTQHVPINTATRDLRLQILNSIHALESYMLFGIDPASASAYRAAREQYIKQADDSMAKLRQYARFRRRTSEIASSLSVYRNQAGPWLLTRWLANRFLRRSGSRETPELRLGWMQAQRSSPAERKEKSFFLPVQPRL